MIDSTLGKVTFDPNSATLGVPFTLKLTATWTVGITAPKSVYTQSKTIIVEVASLWKSTQLSVSATPLASASTTFKVD